MWRPAASLWYIVTALLCTSDEVWICSKEYFRCVTIFGLWVYILDRWCFLGCILRVWRHLYPYIQCTRKTRSTGEARHRGHLPRQSCLSKWSARAILSQVSVIYRLSRLLSGERAHQTTKAHQFRILPLEDFRTTCTIRIDPEQTMRTPVAVLPAIDMSVLLVMFLARLVE